VIAPVARVECFGQSRPQEGRQHTQNQDAYVIGRSPVPWAALLDGAGNAQTVARRAAALLERWFQEASLGQILREETWRGVARRLDSALMGGPQSTLVAVAVVGRELLGVAVGDSRAYVVPIEGATRLVTDDGSKQRLGSGEVEPFFFRLHLEPRDVVVLLSDGAWGPLGLTGVDRAVRSAFSKPFSETPPSLLAAASRRGCGDDMTSVALRLTV
jgi:serine/threonine protein phosphatase PrpC